MGGLIRDLYSHRARTPKGSTFILMINWKKNCHMNTPFLKTSRNILALDKEEEKKLKEGQMVTTS